MLLCLGNKLSLLFHAFPKSINSPDLSHCGSGEDRIFIFLTWSHVSRLGFHVFNQIGSTLSLPSKFTIVVSTLLLWQMARNLEKSICPSPSLSLLHLLSLMLDG